MDQLRLSGPARPGDVLGGRYRLEELIGEGGMGSVWRATDDVLEREVAVKVFWAVAGKETDATRRESEKRLLASVSHPSLVTLFDAHLSRDGLSFLVMEHVDGGTLSSLIERGPIASRDAASLATDLGEALHVVHRAGIIHRDVKPANILLRPPLTVDHTFRAVLADFGIAHMADATRVTTPGLAMGTAAYISPEQVRGHAPTPASDIYSLGLVLLEALSGSRAFPAQTPIEAISVRLTVSPTVPGRWGYGWRSLLSAMTALDPDARPTAVEVAARARALDAAPEDAAATIALAEVPAQPASATDPAADEPTKVWSTADVSRPLGVALATPSSRRGTRREGAIARRRRRRQRVAGAVALTAAVGTIGLTVWFGSAAPAPQPTPLPQLEQTVNTSDEQAVPVVEPVPAIEPAVDPAPASVEDVGVTDTGAVATDPGAGSTSGNPNSGPGNNSGNGNDKGTGNGRGPKG
jgi:hypothetical protein